MDLLETKQSRPLLCFGNNQGYLCLCQYWGRTDENNWLTQEDLVSWIIIILANYLSALGYER